MRFVSRVLYDAFMRFSQDDGWAIASHIALSILTSLFPFLIFVTALAGFLGSKNLSDEPAFAGWRAIFQRFWSDSSIMISALCWIDRGGHGEPGG
jgi:membrane protein